MMNKPPPIPPPPIPRRDREFDASIRLYWMIALAVLLGGLMAIFSLSWIVNRSDIGQGNNDSNTAIQQKPERIVLLSDGEFDPISVFEIAQANQSNMLPAKIDCVGLMEEVETLKEFARSNKGIYYQAQ